MIHLVAQVINFLGTTLGNAFIVASIAGQLIVIVLTKIFSSITAILKGIFLFFQIVYEDNIQLFTEDLPYHINGFVKGCSDHISFLVNVANHIYSALNTKIYNTCAAIEWSLKTSYTVIGEVLLLLKKSVIFMGDTIWLILTFLPFHLPLLLKDLFDFTQCVLFDISACISSMFVNVFNFIIDVPLESFIGIMSAGILGNICIQHREVISEWATDLYWLAVRKFLYLYYLLFNFFTDSEVRAIARMANGEDIGYMQLETENLMDDDDDQIDPAEALCVICQERQKCILILPCRHVCLCRECCIRLYGYQRTCPICRTFIYHSVTIYL